MTRLRNLRRDPRAPSRVRRAATGAALVIGLLGLTGSLSACSVRLETPAPTTPTPGPAESARQGAAQDAVALAALAAAAADPPTAELANPAQVVPALETVATFSARHAEALGGLYAPWTSTPTPSTTPAPATTAVPTPTDVVEALRAAAQRAAADADAVQDGGLARLLASVATSRSALATALEASVAGVDLAPATEPAEVTEPAAEGGVTGVQDSAISGLIEAHDALGAAWEVLAARASGDERARATLIAETHRTRAQDWATALGIDGTDLDPREAAYALPEEVLDPDADAMAGLLPLETRLGERLASLVAQAEPGARATFIDALEHNARLRLQLTGAPEAFPGDGDDEDTGSA